MLMNVNVTNMRTKYELGEARNHRTRRQKESYGNYELTL